MRKDNTDSPASPLPVGYRIHFLKIVLPYLPLLFTTHSTAIPTLAHSFQNVFPSEMPPKCAQDNMVPEAQGLKYSKFEMALFLTQLAWRSTYDERMASQDSNLTSVTEAQGQILKRWKALMDSEKELAGKEENFSPSVKREMAVYEWRYKRLEATMDAPEKG